MKCAAMPNTGYMYSSSLARACGLRTPGKTFRLEFERGCALHGADSFNGQLKRR